MNVKVIANNINNKSNCNFTVRFERVILFNEEFSVLN